MAATGVSPADLIARAQALRPLLLERQEATERDTRYSQETHAEFLAAGFYRMLIPRMFGGLEVGVETFAKVMIEIARGCPSTGWGLCLASGHALQVGSFFSEQAQADVFGYDGDFRCAAAFAPRDVLTRTEDGWAVEGTFPYASGAPFSTHLLAQSPLPDGVALFVVPRSEWTIVDDWGDTLGLRGSGSNSVNLDGARIPEHFALPGVDLMGMPPGVETPGLRLHGNPMYAHRPAGFYGVEAAAVVVGMARGAVDEYERGSGPARRTARRWSRGRRTPTSSAGWGWRSPGSTLRRSWCSAPRGTSWRPAPASSRGARTPSRRTSASG